MKNIFLLAGSLIVIFVSVSYAAPVMFTVQPYLLDVTQTTAVIAFELSESQPARVTLYRQDQYIRTFPSDPNTLHFVPVTGLEPGRTYRYEVICGTDLLRTPKADSSYQIRTSGRPGDSFRFVVYGDPRPGESLTQRHHQSVMREVARNDPVFVAILGDMVDQGRNRNQWRDFFTVESPVLRRAAVYPVMGDNDYDHGQGIASRYLPPLQNRYYRFEWSGVQLFALYTWDTRGTQPESEFNADSEQVQWLTTQLAQPSVQQAPFRVVFMHDPVFISRGRSARRLRTVYAPLFEKHQVDLVFSSWHLYERSQHNHVHYVVSGGAGAELIWMNRSTQFPSLIDARRHHFCRVDISSNALTLRAIAEDGTVLDQLTLTPQGRMQQAAQQRFKRLAQRLAQSIPIDGGGSGPCLPVLIFAHDCPYCRQLVQSDLPRWARDNQVNLDVRYYDLKHRGAYDLFMAAGADFGHQQTELPSVFVGRSAVGGKQAISTRLPQLIRRFADDPQAFLNNAIQPFVRQYNTGQLREHSFKALSFGVVLVAGLLDGVNPCAFTTLIFLISYLTLVGGTRKQILITGGLFSMSVFVTYLLMGIGLFQVAKVLAGLRGVADIVNILMLVLLLLLALFSLIDGIRAFQGRARESLLQLTDATKGRIRHHIRHFARHQFGTAVAACTLGALISVLELGCTGQVYLPIVTMLSDAQHRPLALGYLLVYNLMFIMPLLVVFMATGFGVSSERLGMLFKAHVAWIKLALALLFVVMAGVIVHNLGWIR